MPAHSGKELGPAGSDPRAKVHKMEQRCGTHCGRDRQPYSLGKIPVIQIMLRSTTIKRFMRDLQTSTADLGPEPP
jgi:hypothetical protein